MTIDKTGMPPFPKKEDPNYGEKRRAYAREYQRRLLATPEGRAAAANRKRKYRQRPEVREKERAYAREWNRRNPERVRDNVFKVHHGVTRAESDRMAAERGNLCDICRKPPSGRGHCSRLHVDHDAETGRIRGMLCHACNRGIGFLRHNLDTLRSAIDYLQRE